MKRFMLTAAALTFGLFAYAQDIPGSPTAGYVAPLPGAGAGANTGLSEQYGNAQRVRVRQAGTEQSVYTRQDNGSGTGGNMAEVVQTGSVQASSGFRNATEVLQSGTTNSSLTRQEGDLNNAVTRQGQNNDASSNNKAYIRQGVADQAEGNRAAIDQDGDGNLARTRQTYDNSDAWTIQNGIANKSMINQNAGPNQTDGHSGYNFQLGEGNESTIMQSGNGGRNMAEAVQVGDFNQAKQTQVTSASAGQDGNRASVLQGFSADANLSPVAINRSVTTEAFSRFNSYQVDPLPALWYTPPPSTEGNAAKQEQYGQGNEAEIWQIDGTVDGASYAEQIQAVGSSDNDAYIGQGHWFDGEADNYAKQYQEGAGNFAGINSSGSGQKVLQDQRGNDNNALTHQVGKDHRANTHQRGNQNDGVIGQRGAGNKALLVQYDGQSYTIQQNLNVGAADFTVGGNQADVLQLGPNGDFDADAILCDFEDPMNLDMNFNVPMANTPDICTDCN